MCVRVGSGGYVGFGVGAKKNNKLEKLLTQKKHDNGHELMEIINSASEVQDVTQQL